MNGNNSEKENRWMKIIVLYMRFFFFEKRIKKSKSGYEFLRIALFFIDFFVKWFFFCDSMTFFMYVKKKIPRFELFLKNFIEVECFLTSEKKGGKNNSFLNE